MFATQSANGGLAKSSVYHGYTARTAEAPRRGADVRRIRREKRRGTNLELLGELRGLIEGVVCVGDGLCFGFGGSA